MPRITSTGKKSTAVTPTPTAAASSTSSSIAGTPSIRSSGSTGTLERLRLLDRPDQRLDRRRDAAGGIGLPGVERNVDRRLDPLRHRLEGDAPHVHKPARDADRLPLPLPGDRVSVRHPPTLPRYASGHSNASLGRAAARCDDEAHG